MPRSARAAHARSSSAVAKAFVLAFSTTLSSLAFAGGLSWGPPPEPEVEPFVPMTVDQLGTFAAPTRLALSSTGELYVSDWARGVVAIYDTVGVRTGTLSGLRKPLGVALREVGGIGIPCSEPEGPPGLANGLGGGAGNPVARGLTRAPGAPPAWGANDGGDPCLGGVGGMSVTTWVADEGDGSVRVFQDGLPLGALGVGAGEFVRPNGVAATSDRVYVVDSALNRIMVYTDETLLFGFGEGGAGDGELDFPTDIAVAEDLGEVYIADFNNARVAVFDLEGRWLRGLAAPMNDDGDPAFFRAAGLGLGPDGNLYVVDNALSCVVVMDDMGSLVDIHGYQDGRYWTGDLKVPIDAVADSSYVYVTSRGHGHVQVFLTTGGAP